VANQYRSQGYQVFVEPRVEGLPDFLREFRPDLVARGKKENVVVEVKQWGDRESAPNLRALADAIRRHPGWRLRVLVTEQDSTVAEEPSRPLTPGEILNELNSVRALEEEGHKAAAFLLLWSLLEAAARTRLVELGVERPTPQPATAMVKDLVAHGLVPEVEYPNILAWMATRNTAAHGFPTRPIPNEAFSGLFNLVHALATIPTDQ
ncbi:MAG: hypothetical protein KIT00_11190, partial [Rhodospirillales bacterium]|nr:hypothetical protein [Rhodospirillales bacterium]